MALSRFWADGQEAPRRKSRDAFERSPKQEASSAKRYGGKVTRGSGSGQYDKGDVRTKTALIENKTTKHKSFSVTVDLIDKIEEEASARGGLIPVMEVELQLGAKKVAVIPTWALETLLEKANGPSE